MKSGTDSKLKFKQLQAALSLARWEARGLLDSLWNFVAENCPSGDVGRYTDSEIAIGIEWRGDSTKLIEVLIATRWLDRIDGASRILVHDWPEHCERNVHKMLGRRCARFANGETPNISGLDKSDREKAEKAYKNAGRKKRTTHGRPQAAAGCPPGAPALPSLTLPSLTNTLPTKSCGEASSPPPSPESDSSEFVFPIVGKGPREWTLTAEKLREYIDAFPGLDVPAQIRLARQWCRDNSAKRKTAKGMFAFLGRWLSREQNRGGSNGKVAVGTRRSFMNLDDVDLEAP